MSRFAPLLLVALLCACAPTAPRTASDGCDPLRPAGTPCRATLSAEALADDARADSLSRVDSLTTADATWLARYAVAGRYDPERQAVARTERADDRNRTVAIVLGLGALLGVVGAVWLVQGL